MTGGDRAARMQRFAEDTGRTIVVTLGGDGVLAATPDEMLEVAALSGHAGRHGRRRRHLLRLSGAGLAAGLPLEQALQRAAAAGSLACLKPGAQPAIPHARRVDAALAPPR